MKNPTWKVACINVFHLYFTKKKVLISPEGDATKLILFTTNSVDVIDQVMIKLLYRFQNNE